MPNNLDIFDSFDFEDFTVFFDREFYPAEEVPPYYIGHLQGIRFEDGTEVIDSKTWNEKYNEFISWEEIQENINEKLNN